MGLNGTIILYFYPMFVVMYSYIKRARKRDAVKGRKPRIDNKGEYHEYDQAYELTSRCVNVTH